MSKEDRKLRQGPPYNPGVGDLVREKRRWSSPPELVPAPFQGWHERGYLPHRDEPGLIQFATFRLADAFPNNLRAEWASMLEIENDLERRKQLEEYLDQGRGACHLKRAEIGSMVDQAIRFYHDQLYGLRAWAVMPNHAHILIKVLTVPLPEIIRRFKGYTAREANKLLRKQGPFWAEDYWDTYMRNEAHEVRTAEYIENNPVKACLVREPKDWPWSSARYRDEVGRLQI